MNPPSFVRALNAVLSVALVVLLFLHASGNAFVLFGVGSPVPVFLGYVLIGLAGVHLLLGIYLTVVALAQQAKAGAAYWGLNKRFWAVRISGLAIALFVIAHVLDFALPALSGAFRLAPFDELALALHLLLALALAVHVALNAEPLMVSLGVPLPGPRALDVAIVVCLLMLFIAAAFVVYYLRWSVI